MILMAVVNRRSGMARGASKIWQLMAAFGWKGLQITRNFGSNIDALHSKSTGSVRGKIIEFTDHYKTDLTLEQRNMWDQYAASLGSAVDREKSDNVSNAKNVIPRHRRVLLSGLNAYIAANINAFLAGLATPLDIAPLGAAVPAPPLGIDVSYASPAASVTFTNPVIGGTPVAKFARLWVKLYGDGTHAQMLVPLIPLPSIGPATFTEVRIGNGFASPKIALASYKQKLILRVQMDTLVQRAIGEGPVIGPGSNVAETLLVNP